MATSPYNVQQVSCQAYGWINGTGATAAGFNCSMTRVSTGFYRLKLGPSDGVLQGQSWISAAVEQEGSTAGRYVTPIWVDNTTRDFAVRTDGGTDQDCSIEVVVWKTNVNIAGV